MKYNECNKIVRKIAFEKAISVEQKEVNIADSINLDAMSKNNILLVHNIINVQNQEIVMIFAWIRNFAMVRQFLYDCYESI